MLLYKYNSKSMEEQPRQGTLPDALKDLGKKIGNLSARPTTDQNAANRLRGLAGAVRVLEATKQLSTELSSKAEAAAKPSELEEAWKKEVARLTAEVEEKKKAITEVRAGLKMWEHESIDTLARRDTMEALRQAINNDSTPHIDELVLLYNLLEEYKNSMTKLIEARLSYTGAHHQN